MPRYFFDIRDSFGLTEDETGVELPDMDTAIVEARRALAEMTREQMSEPGHDKIHILIRDGADGPVHLKVSMDTESPETF